jgi:hypothetical protein
MRSDERIRLVPQREPGPLDDDQDRRHHGVPAQGRTPILPTVELAGLVNVSSSGVRQVRRPARSTGAALARL